MSGCGIRKKENFHKQGKWFGSKRVWRRTRRELAAASAESWEFPEWYKNFMGR